MDKKCCISNKLDVNRDDGHSQTDLDDLKVACLIMAKTLKKSEFFSS